MTHTSIILLVVVALAVIALLWLIFGRGKGSATPTPTEATETRPLDRVAPSVSETPAPPPAVPVAMQGVLPGTLSEIEQPAAAEPAPPASLVSDIVPQADERDNLAMMKGVGPKIVSLLNAQGITHFAQIAAWTDADVDAIDAQMGSFRGRIRRDNWVDQARFLAVGDRAGYEAKYGKL